MKEADDGIGDVDVFVFLTPLSEERFEKNVGRLTGGLMKVSQLQQDCYQTKGREGG